MNKNRLFLFDLTFQDFEEEQTLPVIGGWEWHLKGDGRGWLENNYGEQYFKFDIAKKQVQINNQSDWQQINTLTFGNVQSNGERYLCQNHLSPQENVLYEKMAAERKTQRGRRDKEFRQELGACIRVEYTGDVWISHINTEQLNTVFGVTDIPTKLSKHEGVELFNNISKTHHVEPLRDPIGYMRIENNMYDYIHQTYYEKYDDILQDIHDNIVDGTGYGVQYILDNLSKTIRKDMKDCLPYNMKYSDLSHIHITPERTTAVDKFVKARISKTLVYEKKRGYEQATIDRTDQQLISAGVQLRDTLRKSQEQALAL